MWVSKPSPFSSVCRNLTGQRPLGAEIWPFKEVEFGSVNISHVSSVVTGPKFTIFSLNVGGIVVDNASFRLSISGSVPHIFTIKV